MEGSINAPTYILLSFFEVLFQTHDAEMLLVVLVVVCDREKKVELTFHVQPSTRTSHSFVAVSREEQFKI
jgi:hypothetical protein